MTEIGLVTFARVALETAQAVMPAYRSKFSKRQFTQPQLLTIVRLMRYEDWTFREAEVRLAEHSGLRQALGLQCVPDYTTLYRFLRRLDERLIEQVLREVMRRLPPPKGGGQTTVAVDATGLTPGAVSTFFVKQARDRGPGFTWRYWLKWTVVVDVPRRLILAQVARQGPYNDCATLRPWSAPPARWLRLGPSWPMPSSTASATTSTFAACWARSIIPAKKGKASWRIQGVRAQMRRRLPRRRYGARALVESVFSAVKRKLSGRAPGRSLETQRLQALLLGLTYNLYRL